MFTHRKPWIAVIIILAMALALTACTRSATGKIQFTPLPKTTPFPTPVSAGIVPAATQSAPQTAVPKSKPPQKQASPTPKPKPTATPAPTKAPTQKPAPTATVPSKYVIHKGEYPYCLARRFDVDPDALLRANNLVRGQPVYPGTVLTIPKNAGHFPYQRAWHPHPTDYTVRYGDTIYTIACWFGDVTPEAIAKANGITVNTPLTPGQVLHIP